MSADQPQPRASVTPDYQRDWPEYFRCVEGQPPRDTCLRALNLFDRESPANSHTRFAIDLACGEGRDTRAIVSRPNWRAIAIDGSESAFESLRARTTSDQLNQITCVLLRLEDVPTKLVLPPSAKASGIHFINASFALPFCNPTAFPNLWTWITTTLNPGGRFAGQFFGDRDDWSSIRPASHFTRKQVEDHFTPSATNPRGFTLEYLEEVEKDGSDAMGGTKHHHVFHIVAQKCI
jgi:hypothetical protein